MKKHGAGCCGDLHMKGSKGFSNSKADRVADAHVKGHYGGCEGGHNEANETEADERREHG